MFVKDLHPAPVWRETLATTSITAQWDTTTPHLWVTLSLMLNQQPVESYPLIRQVSKAHGQSFRQCVIVTIFGLPKPLLHAEGAAWWVWLCPTIVGVPVIAIWTAY